MDKKTIDKLKPAILGLIIVIICAVKAFSGGGIISSGKDDSSSKSSSSSVAARSDVNAVSSSDTDVKQTTKATKTTSADKNTVTTTAEAASVTSETKITEQEKDYIEYYFRTRSLRDSHYEKHGIEMGFSSADEYRHAASNVINNPDALSKIEKEDGDTCYYIEETDEFVVLSTDGYIRTYFNPGGKAYFDRQ